MVAMVHELAAFENASDQCRLTERQLDAALFRPGAALFGHVALAPATAAATAQPPATSPTTAPAVGSATGGRAGPPEVVGLALWFLNFSTWAGVHGIYLEDLYVRPGTRGAGAGRALMTSLAQLCLDRGYERLDWWVLHWNPARDFYARLGAQPMDEWIPYRLTGSALADLAGPAVHGLTGAAVHDPSGSRRPDLATGDTP